MLSIITFVFIYGAFKLSGIVNRTYVPGLIGSLPNTPLGNSMKTIHFTALVKSFVWVSLFFVASIICSLTAPLPIWILTWAALFGLVHIKPDVLD